METVKKGYKISHMHSGNVKKSLTQAQNCAFPSIYMMGNGHQLRHARTRVLLALDTEPHYTHCTCSEGMCVSSIAMRLPRLFFGFTIVDVFHFMCAMCRPI